MVTRDVTPNVTPRSERDGHVPVTRTSRDHNTVNYLTGPSVSVNGTVARPHEPAHAPARGLPPALLEQARAAAQRNLGQPEPEPPALPAAVPPPATAWTDGQLQVILNHRLAEAVADGFPPRRPQAFVAEMRRRELAAEAERPGWIATCAAALEAKRCGQRITGWRWVRGTHSGQYVADPRGTDVPPKGYA